MHSHLNTLSSKPLNCFSAMNFVNLLNYVELKNKFKQNNLIKHYVTRPMLGRIMTMNKRKKYVLIILDRFSLERVQNPASKSETTDIWYAVLLLMKRLSKRTIFTPTDD